MPDIPSGNLRKLMEALHELYRRAGMPGVRPIAKKTTASHAAVHALFTKARTQPPNQRIMLEVVETLLPMQRRAMDEKEADDTLDWFDALWQAAAREWRDPEPADGTPPAAHTASAHDARGAMEDKVADAVEADDPAPVVPRADEENPPGDSLAALLAAFEDAGARRIARWREEGAVTPAAAAEKREAAISRAVSRFSYLQGKDVNRPPRYRRVDFAVWSTTAIDAVLAGVEDLAEPLWFCGQKDAEEGLQVLKLYVVAHGRDDIGFWCAAEETATDYDARFLRIKHVATPTPVEMDILTLLREREHDLAIANRLGISVEEVTTYRKKSPQVFKVKNLREALHDASHFRLIPTSVASRGWHGRP